MDRSTALSTFLSMNCGPHDEHGCSPWNMIMPVHTKSPFTFAVGLPLCRELHLDLHLPNARLAGPTADPRLRAKRSELRVRRFTTTPGRPAIASSPPLHPS